MGVTWCVCTAAGSLCQACFGSTAVGTTGRKRSVLLLTIATTIALWFQYSVGPAIVTKSGMLWKLYSAIPGLGKILFNAWHQSCADRYDNGDSNTELLQQCAGKAGVMRPMAVAALFFAIQAVATNLQPSLNREAWPAKYVVYLVAVFITCFMSNEPLFTGVFLWLARFGATLFVVLQQSECGITRRTYSLLIPSFLRIGCSLISFLSYFLLAVILIDIAYDWNEDWVERADQEDRISYGSGSSWLHAIVATCATFYITAITGIGLLYSHFSGCPENVWIITLTLLGIIAFTAIQLAGSEGSLLTSSIISVYTVYLAYSMVSKNPNSVCNPHLASNDAWGITIGLSLTAISLAWTGWSWTAESRLNLDGVQTARSLTSATPSPDDAAINLEAPFLDPNDQPTAGLVTDSGAAASANDSVGSDVWKLNVVLVTICCFVAMILTGWGTVLELDETESHLANPTAGRVNMAMIGVSQWMAIGLYIWTLVAPRLFPDRDFM